MRFKSRAKVGLKRAAFQLWGSVGKFFFMQRVLKTAGMGAADKNRPKFPFCAVAGG